MPSDLLTDIGHILLWIVDKILWFFQSEERIVLKTEAWGWPNGGQLFFVWGFNALLIMSEIGFWRFAFWGLRKFKCLRRFQVFSKNPEMPHWIVRITSGKIPGPLELGILAFTPGFQKIGILIFVIDRGRYGLRDYLAMCLGGMLRLTIMVLFMSEESIWILIAFLVVFRIRPSLITVPATWAWKKCLAPWVKPAWRLLPQRIRGKTE